MIRIFVIVMALVAAACNSPSGPDAVAGEPFELKAGASSVLPDGMTLKFDRVESDSRCPIDAICITAGDAIVTITLTPERGGSSSRQLHTQPGGSQISYGSYNIALTELQPYPRSSRPANPADYVATFIVSVR